MDTDVELLAYLAGAIDADGSIMISKHDHTSSVGTRIYSEMVVLAQLSPVVPELLRQRFGGHVQLRKRKGDHAVNWRPMYYWYGNTKIGAAAVAALRPHLRIKTAQADVLLALRASKETPATIRRSVRVGVRWKATNPEVVEYREKLYQQIRALNRTGIAGVSFDDGRHRTG